MRALLNRCRRVRRISRADLARMIGVGPDMIEAMEGTSKRPPPADRYIQAALALDAPEMLDPLIHPWSVERRGGELRARIEAAIAVLSGEAR